METPTTMPNYRPIAERFAEKIRVNRETGCWEWTGSRLKAGYGQLGKEKGAGLMLAHRYSYEQNVGPIPAGMIVCHRCDNPPCCNPEHLFLGDHGANMKDMERKGRGRILTAAQVDEALRLWKGGMSLTKVAAHMGVARMTVTRALEKALEGDLGPAETRAANEPTLFRFYTKIGVEQHPEIIRLLNEGETVSEVARRFGCDRRTIRNIKQSSSSSELH